MYVCIYIYIYIYIYTKGSLYKVLHDFEVKNSISSVKRK